MVAGRVKIEGRSYLGNGPQTLSLEMLRLPVRQRRVIRGLSLICLAKV